MAAFSLAVLSFALLIALHKLSKDDPSLQRLTTSVSTWLFVLGGTLCLYVIWRISRQLIAPTLPGPVDKPAAIKGPLPFGPRDAAIFSRLQRVDEIRNLLGFVLDDQSPVCVLRSVSGCGKTSLLRAGLSEASRTNGIALIYWEATPVAAAESLLAAVQDGWTEGEKPKAIAEIAATRDAHSRVIAIDQAEEVSPTIHTEIFEAITATVKRGAPFKTKWIISFKQEYDSTWIDYEKSIPRFYPQYFRLDPFTVRQASDVIAVLAEESNLTLDRQGVSEMLESVARLGLVSPVEIGIGMLSLSELARELDTDHLTHQQFRNAGGAAGLQSGYLQKSLGRLAERERQETISALWHLVDIEKNERLAAGRSVAELQRVVNLQQGRLEEILEYLSSPQVRLLEKLFGAGEIRYRLPHERLIAALRVVSGKVLEEAEKASLLLDRRYRMWAPDKEKHLLLTGSELRRILRQKRALRWGEYRSQKESYLKTSRRRQQIKWVSTGFATLAGVGILASLLVQQVEDTTAQLGAREEMPQYKAAFETYVPGQSWSFTERQWFYHVPVGTVLVPYKWFTALEQPEIKIFGRVSRFRDTTYLGRFGFLPGIADQNPDGLPIGLVKDTVVDPQTGQAMEVVGLTCAACHTGQLEYKGVGIRIDGGSSMFNMASFQRDLGYALAYTDKIPFRFYRFSKAVLGENASDDAKRKLRQEFESFLNSTLAPSSAAEAGKIYREEGGFGRTDILGRIGNSVFGTELRNDSNLRSADAAAKIPPLWDASWFNWAQYNASIQQPIVRDVSEVLGIRARVNLSDPKKLYDSTVNVKSLRQIENLLAGPTAFTGLRPPSWPEQVLGPIDRAKAQNGAELYKRHCQGCHLPPLDSPEIQNPEYWDAGLDGKRFLRLKTVSLDSVGTDPKEAANWAQRTAVADGLGLGTVSAAEILRFVTAKIRDMNYDTLGLSPAQRMEWNGYREGGVIAPLAYRARPLGGLWATPPFLHNGSVPSLYALLSPVVERPRVFYIGSREFDPQKVGYSTAKFDGGYEFRVDLPGNSNAGHEFRDRQGKGVIGPELSPEERWAIIEYLKTL